MNNPHIGTNFDDFLIEEGIKEAVLATANKRVIAWQLAQVMAEKGITQTEMAKRMHTSRATVRRLLDGTDTGVTLATLARAGAALGLPLQVKLGG